MAVGIGSIQGQSYALPGSQGYGQGGFIGQSQAEVEAQKVALAPETGQAVLPNINQDIAQIEGITGNYYDNYGQLKAYVESMNKIGIDVTKPDYSQPEGGEPFKTYKKLEAGLMNTANTLKNELAYRRQIEPQIMADKIRYLQGVDPRTQVLSERSPQETYYTTDTLPEVQAANAKLKEVLYYQGDVNRYNREIKEPLIADLTRRMNASQSPAERAMIQNNINALANPSHVTDPNIDRIAARAANRTTPDGVNMARKVLSIVKGYLPEGQYKTEQVDGQTAAVNTELAGYSYGKYQDLTKPGSTKETAKEMTRVIDKVVHFPDERVLIYFKNADNGDPIPPEDITGASGDTILGLLKQSNPKSMGKLPQFDLTPEGSYSEESIYGEVLPTVEKYGQEMMGKIKTVAPNIAATKQKLTSELKSVPKAEGKGWISDDNLRSSAVTITLKNSNGEPAVYRIARGEDGLYSIEPDNTVVGPFTEEEFISNIEAQGLINQYQSAPYQGSVKSGVSGKWGIK